MLKIRKISANGGGGGNLFSFGIKFLYTTGKKIKI